jgi:hypothetical protein
MNLVNSQWVLIDSEQYRWDSCSPCGECGVVGLRVWNFLSRPKLVTLTYLFYQCPWGSRWAWCRDEWNSENVCIQFKISAERTETHQLICQEEDSFQTEEVEEVFGWWAKKTKNHIIVITFGAKPSDERDAYTAHKSLINLGLIFELEMLGFQTHNFFTRDDINSQVDRLQVRNLSECWIR